GQVLDGEVEEEVLARPAGGRPLADRVVVVVAVRDRVVEDRRVRGEARHRQLVDVAFELAAREERAGDVVEPEALAGIVESLRGLHVFLRGFAAASSAGRSQSTSAPTRSIVTSGCGYFATSAACA